MFTTRNCKWFSTNLICKCLLSSLYSVFLISDGVPFQFALVDALLYHSCNHSLVLKAETHRVHMIVLSNTLHDNICKNIYHFSIFKIWWNTVLGYDEVLLHLSLFHCFDHIIHLSYISVPWLNPKFSLR